MAQETDRAYVIECPHCETVQETSPFGSTEDHNPEHGPPGMYVLLRCTECHGVTLILRENYGAGWDAPYRLWPAQRRALSTTIPPMLREQHEEARKCFEVKAFTATVVMVRRTLEGVCVDKGIKEKVLFKSLEKLRDEGHIDEKLYGWAQELRALGNEGAHFTGKQVSREDATEALDFAEALLDYTYVLTQKFNEFQARRRAAKSAPSEELISAQADQEPAASQ